MKNFIRTVFALLLIISFASCATTSAGNVDNQEVHKENQQTGKKLLFKDWKYKGFGSALPAWFEAAYKGNSSKIKKADVSLSDTELVIIKGEGVNSDQAERVLELNCENVPEGFELFDSFWAMTDDGKYISLALYTKR